MLFNVKRKLAIKINEDTTNIEKVKFCPVSYTTYVAI